MAGYSSGISPSHQLFPTFSKNQVLGLAIALTHEPETLEDGLGRVTALEPGRAVALNRCTKVRDCSVDFGRAGASAVGKPIAKATARSFYRLPARPSQYTVRNSQLAGRR